MPATDRLPTALSDDRAAVVGEFQNWLSAHGRDDVYFVLGVQGSGTNLTVRVLQSLFDISAVLDGSLIFDAAVRVERRPRRDVVEREFQSVYRRLFPGAVRRRFAVKHHHHRNAGFEGVDRHFDPCSVTCGAEFARFFYTYHAWKTGRQHMLVKSDDLWQQIDSLRTLFPQRKCILLVRDPRDNALSIANKDFGPRDIYTAAQFTNRQMTLYRREAECRPGDSITVRYETLLDDPLNFARAFAERFGFVVPPDAADRLGHLAIRNDNSQKWRRLSSRDLAACEWVLERHLRDFGYPLSGQSLEPLSLVERLVHRFVDDVRRIPQKVGREVRCLTGRS